MFDFYRKNQVKLPADGEKPRKLTYKFLGMFCKRGSVNLFQNLSKKLSSTSPKCSLKKSKKFRYGPVQKEYLKKVISSLVI